jgi:hypothetical protein
MEGPGCVRASGAQPRQAPPTGSPMYARRIPVLCTCEPAHRLSTCGHRFPVSPLDPPRTTGTRASCSCPLSRRYDDGVWILESPDPGGRSGPARWVRFRERRWVRFRERRSPCGGPQRSCSLLQGPCGSPQRSCSSLRRSCSSPRRLCSSLQRSCSSLQRPCSSPQRPCSSSQRSCSTSPRSCSPLQRPCSTLPRPCSSPQRSCSPLQQPRSTLPRPW